MKNLSLIFNLLLLAAVGFLFYRTFSSNKSSKSNIEAIKTIDSSALHPKIAYVELDSLNENITYFKLKRKELEQQQKKAEAEIVDDMKALEAKQNNFVQKNPNATPDQIQAIRMQLAQGQQDIETKKQTHTQLLNQKSFELMQGVQKKLKDFLFEYNKKKNFQYILTTGNGIDFIIYKDSTLDITKDVVTGMNEKLKAESNH